MRLRSGLVIVGIIAGLVLVIGYLAAAAVVYDNVSRVPPECGGRFPTYTPADWSAAGASTEWEATRFDATPYLVPSFEEVRFPSRDAGIELHAWWLPQADGATGPVIVGVPGRGACVRDPILLAPAGMLWHLGYSVLLVDLRDQGSSTVEDGRFAGGTDEYRDVLAAVDWLEDRGYGGGEYGLMGCSMGAASALIAGGEDARIGGVWVDSSFADIVTRIREELEQRGYPGILARAGPLMGRLIGGDDFDSFTPLGAMAKLSGRHLMIAHGTADQSTYVTHAGALVGEAWRQGVLTDVWVSDGAGHCQEMFLDPAAYQARMGEFFETAIGSPGA